jgi:hypothetical protein
MRLPNAERALVEREKVESYLLNPAHPDNGGKASFFISLGFCADKWPVLAEALRQLAAAVPFARSVSGEVQNLRNCRSKI